MANEGKLNIIRGLLAKAESTDSPEEAEALRAKAVELIGKYDVDERLLRVSRGEDRTAVANKVIKVEGEGYIKQKLSLIHGIARALGLYGVTTTSPEATEERIARIRSGQRTRRSFDSVHLFGTEGSIELVEVLYTSLLIQLESELAGLTFRDVPVRTAVTCKTQASALRSHRTSFAYGWVDRVETRLTEAHGRAVQEADEEQGTSTELVVQSETDRYKAAATAHFGKLQTRKVTVNAGGWGAGSAAGNRADIGLSRVGGKRGQLTR